ncbi:hypothetical protein BKA64DRAFT_766797 [Cadophora sp. MPI-SDFR-AT-0126]|nr:hypothetical protein BKA64DRAFT_766797 [Leotiomycetes sp. MPI-SDFR-AT-0126]
MSQPEVLSCLACRHRKVRCDRDKPKCGRCLKTKRDCSYPERKRVATDWRRPDTKALETSLSAAEGKLARRLAEKSRFEINNGVQNYNQQNECDNTPSILRKGYVIDSYSHHLLAENASIPRGLEYMSTASSSGPTYFDGRTLEEPLPPEKMQEELFKIYFDQIHACIPMISKLRFYATRRLGLNGGPLLALQYAMWSIAASVSPRHEKLCEAFLQRAKKYAQRMEVEEIGEPYITLYDVQTWCLIANIEAQRMHIARAWTSSGKCVRLVQLMGLHCVGRPMVYATRFVHAIEDSIELEERRRTFWAAYLCDRWTSALGGWPMAIQESGIGTDLPSSEAGFDSEHKEASISLAEAMAEGGASNIPSSFSGVVLATTILAREYAHIQKSAKFKHTHKGDDKAFWDTHREMDNALSNTLMYLPERFKTAPDLCDPNAVFVSIALQAATICLHRTAIDKAMSSHVYNNIVSHSWIRCISAAHAVTSIIRLVGYQDMSRMNPWAGFCLYLAALVYCHDLRSNQLPDRQHISNATLLLATMKVIGTTQPITEYFSVQLELEMDLVKRSPTWQQEIAQQKSSLEYHDPTDPTSGVQNSETQFQFWRSLSDEEREILSRKVLSPKPSEGILALNCNSFSFRNNP